MKRCLLTTISFIISVTLFAQSSKNVKIKNGSSYVHFLKSTSQRINPGRPEVPPHTEYRFILIWKSTQTPQSIFWNSDTGSMACNVYKVHRSKSNTTLNADITGNEGYDKTITDPATIKRGDTIEVWPIKGYSSFPTNVKKIKKALIVRTKNNSWLYIPTKNIIVKPAVNMP